MWLEFARWEWPFEKMRFPIELVGCLGLHRQAQGALGRALSPVASRFGTLAQADPDEWWKIL
jgi:hypothetical protein